MSKFYIPDWLNKEECDLYYECEEVINSVGSNHPSSAPAFVRMNRLFDAAWNRYQASPSDRTTLIDYPDSESSDYYDTHDKSQE